MKQLKSVPAAHVGLLGKYIQFLLGVSDRVGKRANNPAAWYGPSGPSWKDFMDSVRGVTRGLVYNKEWIKEEIHMGPGCFEHYVDVLEGGLQHAQAEARMPSFTSIVKTAQEWKIDEESIKQLLSVRCCFALLSCLTVFEQANRSLAR